MRVSIGDQFMFNNIDSSTAFTHLSSLDMRKSTGPGDLSSRFLKEVASEIAEPLASLFNYSLQEKVVLSACMEEVSYYTCT